jgi:SET domain-containing protein
MQATPRPEHPGLSVRRGLSGLGLFTTVPIKRDSFVIEYWGEMITNEESDRRGGKYLFDIENGTVIDGTTRKNRARYVNHSCRPNCEVRTRGKRVFIYAIKNIKPGDELSYDYGHEYWGEHIKPFGCRCAKCGNKK